MPNPQADWLRNCRRGESVHRAVISQVSEIWGGFSVFSNYDTGDGRCGPTAEHQSKKRNAVLAASVCTALAHPAAGSALEAMKSRIQRR